MDRRNKRKCNSRDAVGKTPRKHAEPHFAVAFSPQRFARSAPLVSVVSTESLLECWSRQSQAVCTHICGTREDEYISRSDRHGPHRKVYQGKKMRYAIRDLWKTQPPCHPSEKRFENTLNYNVITVPSSLSIHSHLTSLSSAINAKEGIVLTS
jgi:hypothetical protein